MTDPTVSIILPTLNERRFIRDCLNSLEAQDSTDIVEILVLDGGSTDGTREIVVARDGLVRLLDNPGVTAAAALNLGLAEAKGDVIARADAHTRYAEDYVRRCVEVLEETGAANVGGPMRPTGTTRFGHAVAAVTSSPLGIGPGRFHYGTERQDVDTVYLGCWLRETLDRLGGWDDRNLQWGAEDHELNHRLRQVGGRIILDPSIRSWYFPRETLRALLRQYRNYGLGKASTLAKHRTLPSWRPLAPAALVAGSVVLALVGRGAARVLLPAAHGAAATALALRLAAVPGVDPARAFVAVEVCHWAYGLGFWQGVGRILRRAAFDARPAGRR